MLKRMRSAYINPNMSIFYKLSGNTKNNPTRNIKHKMSIFYKPGETIKNNAYINLKMSLFYNLRESIERNESMKHQFRKYLYLTYLKSTPD